MSERGKLIVLEGLDRADRTTPIGQMINSYLNGTSEQEDHVIHLLFSANRWEAAAGIKADIDAGTTVIIDRYYYSGCVYSAAKDNPTLPLAWARHPEVGLPKPDICVFLDIAPEEAAKRGGFGEEKYETKRIQDRVREIFAELREAPEKGDFYRIDAGKTVEEVGDDIWRAILDLFQRVDMSGAPLGTVQAW
ncbi:thymidylate kinase [Venturia nashicola]|nr:thymidylate kinase [Venturia nashicola]